MATTAIGVDGRITATREQATPDGAVLTAGFSLSGFNGSDLRCASSTSGDTVTRLALGG